MIATNTNIGIATFTDIDLLLMEYPTETLPVSENEEEIEETISEDESLVLFPKSIVKVYPGKKAVRKAKGEYTCDFSGAPIHKGSDYVIFRPMIKDITKGETYVLKRTIRAEVGYESDLPKNIAELEEFMTKIINYENQVYDEDKYNNLFTHTGGGLTFKKLNRRKHENRNSKRS